MKKLVSVLLSLCIMFSFTAYGAYSASAADGVIPDDVNPIYSGCKYTENKKLPPYTLSSDIKISNTIYKDFKSAAMFIRDCMLNRQQYITVSISNDVVNNVSDCYMLNASSPYYAVYCAFSDEIARSGNEGDYLRCCYHGASGSRKYYDGYTEYTYQIRYITTLEEEETLAEFVNTFTASLKEKNLSRLEQIRAIHDKICSVTDYDWDNYNAGNLGGTSDVNTAYSAVTRGKTMCQGYSALFYYLCREMNIPARVVESDTHAWNIVKPVVGKYYYNIDVTWDDSYSFPDEDNPSGCDYFLKCDDEMITSTSHRGYLSDTNTDHDRNEIFTTSSFLRNYPVSLSSFYLNKEGTAICAYCKSAVDGATPTEEHSFVQSVQEPTCCENGKTEYQCSDCDESFSELIVPTGIHQFKEGEKYCAYGCGTVNPDYSEPEQTAEEPEPEPESKPEQPVVTEKKVNTLFAKGKTAAVKYAKLKKRNLIISRKSAISIKNAQGVLSYKKAKGNKKITVSKGGKITVKKGLKKGKYKVKIKVTAAGNQTYKPITKTVTVIIKVK